MNRILTVVGWLWQEKQKSLYSPVDANIWAKMIDRHLSLPHRFVLVTDYPRKRWNEFDPLIEPMELWSDWRLVKNPSWPANRPSCYVRLKAFSEQAREFFGERFVSMDLDCVVTGDLDPLFDRDEDFLIYRRPLEQLPRDRLNPYQASMWMMRAGARKQVWETFKGDVSVHSARAFIGTDQAWITKCLGPDEKGWTAEDGVYGFSTVRRQLCWQKDDPPAGARVVFFYGGVKPPSLIQKAIPRPHCNQCGAQFDLERYRREQAAARYEFPWIAKHYRADGGAHPEPQSMIDISPSHGGYHEYWKKAEPERFL